MKFVFLVLLLVLLGCVNPQDNNSIPLENSQIDDKKNQTDNNEKDLLEGAKKILVDGNPNDWVDIDVFLNEEKGDIREYIPVFGSDKKQYQFDVSAVKIFVDEENFYLLLELVDEVENYFKKNAEQEIFGTPGIAEIFIDIDNDKTTGGNISRTNLEGFEKQLTVDIWMDSITHKRWLGYAVNNYNPIDETFSYIFDENDPFFSFSKQSKYDEEFLVFSKNYVEIKIPSDKIEIFKGQTIRLIFNEKGDDKLSDPVIKKID